MGFAVLSNEFYIRWVREESCKEGLTDEDLAFAYELMLRKGYDRIVFFDRGDRITVQEFVAWARGSGKLFIELFRSDGTPLALCWISGLQGTGRQGYAHFTTLGTGAPEECARGGNILLSFIGEHTRIRQLLGVTPKAYRHALSFIQSLGFTYLTTLEKAVTCLGKERDAVLTIRELHSGREK